MLIIDPNIEDVNAVFDRIKSYITSNEGEIVSDKDMGIKKLEYQVKKREKGHYYLVEMRVEAKNLPEIEREIKVDEDIIRHLLTVAKKQ
jgi:small subunit ribosomal protein S6